MSWWKLSNSYILEWYEPKKYVKAHALEKLPRVLIYISFIFFFAFFSVLSLFFGANDYFPIGLLLSLGASIGITIVVSLMVFVPRHGGISSKGILVDGEYINFDAIDFVSIDKRIKDNEEFCILMVHCKNIVQYEIAIDSGDFFNRLLETLKKLPVTVK